ncbi:MAG: MFS transporter, partial [Vallitaleaceae bacterium]|nr:MFS transporter [Vallitaleaceae bacterium]
IAMTTLILAILFLSGNGSIELLFVMSAIRAVGSSIQSPAVSAYLPQMVEEEKLTKVNATNGSIQSFVMLVSPMLSGALLTFASIELIFMIDVITAAIAIVILLFFLKVGAHSKALSKEKTTYYKDLVDGIRYIKNHSFLITFFVFITFLFFLFTPVAFLSPLQVTRTFGNDVWRLTAIEVTFAVGMMIGGAIMATWQGFKNRMKTMGFSTIALGVGTLALGLIPNFWIYITVMGFVGVAMPFFHTPMNVIIQEKVEEDYMGRVFGVMIMISSVIMPFGMLIFGPLADVIRIEYMLIGTGGLLVLEGLILLRNQILLKAGE